MDVRAEKGFCFLLWGEPGVRRVLVVGGLLAGEAGPEPGGAD